MSNTNDVLPPRSMNRRELVSLMALGAASALIPGAATAAPAPAKASNVVLVHGLFADGSCWS